MKVLVKFSMENPELAYAEFLRLIKPESFKQSGRYGIATIHKSNLKLLPKLAYTKSVYEILFTSEICNLKRKTAEYNWVKVCKNSYKIQVKGLPDKYKKDLTDIIYYSIKNSKTSKPMVNLKTPATQILFNELDKKIITGKLIYLNKEKFMERRSHLRPVPHPTSLHPKLARCLVNLTALSKGTVTDPFCGTGGILIEAGLAGFKIIGIDIQEKMVESARINLKYYGIKNFNLKVGDALSYNIKSDAVVTDLPYGRNSYISTRPEQLVQKFLNYIYKLTDKAVIVVPDSIKFTCDKWRIVGRYSYYIHKSLTRIIYVLEKY